MMDSYRAACEGAALFDLSARGKIELAGPEARLFLHNLCTNDVKNLAPGAGCEAFLCTAKARVVAHVLVGCFRLDGKEVILLDCEPGHAEKILQHLHHYLISERVELADRTRDFGLLRLVGPQGAALLTKLFGGRLPDQDLHHVAVAFGSPLNDLLCLRRQPCLGLPALDLICPSGAAPQLWETLTKGGAVPACGDTHEILRVEAGTPVFGVDIDDNRLVMEVGRTEQAISYTKGCFLGQEPIVMARDRGHVNRLLVGIKVSGSEVLKPGTRLFHQGAEVGQVTSSVRSPRLGQVVALAYLRRGCWEPGTVVTIEPDSDGRSAEVAALPFAGSV